MQGAPSLGEDRESSWRQGRSQQIGQQVHGKRADVAGAREPRAQGGRQRACSCAQMAGLGEALGLPLSSRHSSNLTSHRLAAELLVGAARGACARYCDRKHSTARYQ
jgi:hypothetical protein